MPGIISYGAYIPYYRLSRDMIGQMWGRFHMQGEKSVAGIDEDPLTMAVASGMDCIKGVYPKEIDALFLATTTAPYIERLNSTIVSSALDFRRDVRNADYANCLRAGSISLLSAIDTVKAGTLNKILVTASDMRLDGAGGEEELLFGDGSAAFLIGNDNVAAEMVDSCTMCDDIVDYWRSSEDHLIRSWEDRFGLQEGYYKICSEVVEKLLKKNQIKISDISKACIYGPNKRRHNDLAGRMGFEPDQVQEPLLDNIGNTGTAQALMTLVSALEKAEPGQQILLVTWGNGCDAVLFRTTDNIKEIQGRRGVSHHLKIQRKLDSYGKYLRWRNLVTPAYPPRSENSPVSLSAEWREHNVGLPLYGFKCKKCGTVQLFMNTLSLRARVCVECRSKDSFDLYRFADKSGRVVSFCHDYLGGGIDPPTTRTVVDFIGGGRGLFDMVDRDVDECRVGMEVEMTFRRVQSYLGIHNYYWKCKPVRR